MRLKTPEGEEFEGVREKVDPDGKTKFNCFERRCYECPWSIVIGGKLNCNYQNRLKKKRGQVKLGE